MRLSRMNIGFKASLQTDTKTFISLNMDFFIAKPGADRCLSLVCVQIVELS